MRFPIKLKVWYPPFAERRVHETEQPMESEDLMFAIPTFFFFFLSKYKSVSQLFNQSDWNCLIIMWCFLSLSILANTGLWKKGRFFSSVYRPIEQGSFARCAYKLSSFLAFYFKPDEGTLFWKCCFLDIQYMILFTIKDDEKMSSFNCWNEYLKAK